jgi:hypothetical protein
LDSTGTFITGTKTSLGEYYAIDGSGNEGISPYLIDSVTNKSPLHHHQLIDNEEFVVNEKEPLTLSWLSKNDLGVNELMYKHGNYGTFNDASTIAPTGGLPFNNTTQVLNTYSGITKNQYSSLVPQTNMPTGGVSIYSYMTGIPISLATNIMTFKFTDLDLSPNTTYKFKISAKILASAPTNAAYTISATPIGTNFTVVSAASPTVISLLTTPTGFWPEINVVFVTSALFQTGDITAIEIRYNTTNAAIYPLSAMNNKTVYYDSASLYKVSTSSIPYVSTVEVVTDNTVYVMPSGYTQNIIPLQDTKQSRFDTPVGPYKIYYPSAQDATTGFWKNPNGSIAKWFYVRIKNIAGTVIGTSQKVYQKSNTCKNCDKFRLKWKNSLGGWDYFTFTKVSKAKTTIERENFKRSRGYISSSGYQELSTDRGYKSLNIKLADTYTIASDWVSDGTAKWLQDLFISDEVYILNPEPFMKYPTTNQFDLEYPVFVAQNEIEFMNNSIEAKLKNFVIDITPAIRFEENSTN